MNITIRRGKIVQSDVGAPSNQMQRRQKNPGRPTSTPGSKDLVVAEQDPPRTASLPTIRHEHCEFPSTGAGTGSDDCSDQGQEGIQA